VTIVKTEQKLDFGCDSGRRQQMETTIGNNKCKQQMETSSENNAFKEIIVKKEAILNRKYCSENKRNRCLV